MRQMLLGGMTVFLLSLPLVGQEQEGEDETLRQRVLEKTMEGFRDSLLDRANLKLDDMQRYLKLADSKLKRPRVYIKGIAKSESKTVEETVSRYLGQIMANSMKGDSFSVNGKFHWLDPEVTDPPEDNAATRITADLVNGSLQVRHNMGGSGFGLGRRTTEVDKMDFWKVALKQFEQEELDRYQAYFKKRKNDMALDGFMALLDAELMLDERQSVKMKELLRPVVTGQHSGSLEQISRQFSSNREIYETDPEFLNPAQLAKWRLMKLSPRTPNW